MLYSHRFLLHTRAKATSSDESAQLAYEPARLESGFGFAFCIHEYTRSWPEQDELCRFSAVEGPRMYSRIKATQRGLGVLSSRNHHPQQSPKRRFKDQAAVEGVCGHNLNTSTGHRWCDCGCCCRCRYCSRNMVTTRVQLPQFLLYYY